MLLDSLVKDSMERGYEIEVVLKTEFDEFISLVRDEYNKFEAMLVVHGIRLDPGIVKGEFLNIIVKRFNKDMKSIIIKHSTIDPDDYENIEEIGDMILDEIYKKYGCNPMVFVSLSKTLALYTAVDCLRKNK